jgi:AcrR family transcriptional regulator
MDNKKVRGKEGKYHHGDLPRTLVAAALELMEQGGINALTLRATARKAGVSAAAPYRHFADKSALLAAVAEDGFRELVAVMEKVKTDNPIPLTRFQAQGLAYVRFALQRPGHFRVMFGPEVADHERYPSLFQVAQRAFDLQVEAVRDCQATGIVRDGDSEHMALVAWSTVHGIASLVLSNQLDRYGATAEEVDQLMARMGGTLFFGFRADGF